MSEATVKNLRQQGYKVRVGHLRYHTNSKEPIFRKEAKGGMELKPRGGVTKVFITTPSGAELKGEAKCSRKDCYNKKFGVKIAIGRAFKGEV